MYWEYAVLGLVQGLTEFLPVSSSGHLILLQHLGVGEESLAFDLLLHVATLLAVCIVYRKKLWELIRHPLSHETLMLLLASVPTAVIAFAIRLLLDDYGKLFLPFGFMVTSALLITGQLFKKKADSLVINPKKAIIAGVVQGIAAFPGISRSGSTISSLLIMKTHPEKAGDFSFLLSIPIILGSALVELIAFDGYRSINYLAAFIGMALAFFGGILAIKVFLRLLKNGSLIPFAVYTFALSIVSFVILY